MKRVSLPAGSSADLNRLEGPVGSLGVPFPGRRGAAGPRIAAQVAARSLGLHDAGLALKLTEPRAERQASAHAEDETIQSFIG